MRIAFYAPMKPPDHPVPSGDRTMARQLIAALRLGGHEVEVASCLRCALREPGQLAALQRQGAQEAARLTQAWREGAPDLWLTYHLYYKAPDVLGPPLCRTLGIAYATAEASHAARRNRQGWQASQDLVVDAVRLAGANLCFTGIDRDGLSRIDGHGRLVDLPAFLDAAAFQDAGERQVSRELRLATLAMMRNGAKLDSYRFLADALNRLRMREWRLEIIGDGAERSAVEAAFAGLPRERCIWHGELDKPAIAGTFARCDLFVWPGLREAYGLAYLEAQATGLPVVALDTAGVPYVVRNGETGLLTAPGDASSFADAIDRLAADGDLRRRLGRAAARFVHGERNMEAAASRLDRVLQSVREPG